MSAATCNMLFFCSSKLIKLGYKPHMSFLRQVFSVSPSEFQDFILKKTGRRSHQRVGTKQNLSHNYMPGRPSHHGCSGGGRSSWNINPWEKSVQLS